MIDVKDILSQILSWTVLVGFSALVFLGIKDAWKTEAAADPPADPTTYVGGALATIVASVVYALFGKKAPSLEVAQQLLRATSLHDVLLVAYGVVYFAAGAATVVTWFFRTARTPMLIRTIASGFVGLAAAVVPAYLTP
jgi:hypothetical protein